MSLRAITGSVDDYGRVHEFEIHKRAFNNTPLSLKAAGEGYARFEHEVIDPYNPPPIQKGALELSVWLRPDEAVLLDELKAADERQFWVVWKIDDAVEWTGYVFMDLSSYEESGEAFRLTLVAKDFTDLKGKTFPIEDRREPIIKTIGRILDNVGFDIPIVTATNWIESHINANQDFLRQIYHETRALRQFGRAANEDDEPITLYEALERILSNYRLIIKQSGGAYRIDQIPAYAAPGSVMQATYDLDGSLDSEGTVDTTTSGKVVIEPDNRDNSGLPGLKRVRVKFDHRNRVSGILLPDEIDIEQSGIKIYEMPFISDGTQVIRMAGSAVAYMKAGATTASSDITIQIVREGADDYYWDGSQWTTSASPITISYTPSGGDVFRAAIDIETDPTPADADGLLRILFQSAFGDTMPAVADLTIYRGMSFEIDNINNTTSDDYLLTQSGGYTESLELPPTWFGDGPNAFGVSALRYGTGDTDITFDSWQFRGSSDWRKLHENLLKTAMDAQRGWRRLLTASVRSPYHPHQVLSYDGMHFYYLGGELDIFTGAWSVGLFEINIETATDNFQELPKYADHGSGSAPPSGGGGGGTIGWGSVTGKPFSSIGTGLTVTGSDLGLDTGFTDGRYFQSANNLSEGDPAAMRSNLGLGDLAVLDKVDTDQIVDGSVTNAKLANSTISGVALGGNLASHTAGNGLTGSSYNGAAARTWAVDPAAPVGIIEGKVGLNRNDPLYLNGSNLDIRNHGEGQRGVIVPESQVIYGEKLFDADIGSPEWISQLLGWRMTEDGHLDTRSGRFGEIFTQSFISDTTISRAGSDFLSESNAQLSEDFQIGTQENLQWQWEISWDSLLEKYEDWADSEGATDYDEIKTRLLFQSLYGEGLDRQWESGDDFMSESYERSVMVVDEHPGQSGFAVFENGHWIRLRAQERDGGLRFEDFWCRVWFPDAYLEYEEYADWADANGANSVDEEKTRQLFSALYGTPQLFNGDGTQSYQVEFVYPKPVDPIVFRAGSVVLSYGLPGQGIIERSAMGAPFDRAFTWHDRPWKEQLYEILWNLGDGSASGGTLGEIEVFIRDVFRTEFDNGGLRIGANADGQGNPGLYIDENNYFLLNRGFKATLEGNFVEADNIIASINASPEGVAIDGIRLHITADTVFDADVVIKGTLDGVDGTFSGTLSGVAANFDSGNIGGFDIDDGDLVGPNVGLASSGTWRIWAGSNTPGSANFRVNSSGKLFATGADISGAITATSGTIGGWEVLSDRITSTNLQLIQGDGLNARIIARFDDDLMAGLCATTSPLSTDVAFWAGSSYGDRNNAPFRVRLNGTVEAREFNFSAGNDFSISSNGIHLANANILLPELGRTLRFGDQARLYSTLNGFFIDVQLGGGLGILGLPTSDPGLPGAIWNNNGQLRISI